MYQMHNPFCPFDSKIQFHNKNFWHENAADVA